MSLTSAQQEALAVVRAEIEKYDSEQSKNELDKNILRFLYQSGWKVRSQIIQITHAQKTRGSISLLSSALLLLLLYRANNSHIFECSFAQAAKAAENYINYMKWAKESDFAHLLDRPPHAKISITSKLIPFSYNGADLEGRPIYWECTGIRYIF
jgi:hypothetical protein